MITRWNKCKNITDSVLFSFAMVLFALTLVCMFTIWNLHFSSDSAAANILAREQMRTGQLFPDTWNTSSGIFIFFYNILIIPLSFFTQNQILLRDAAVAIVLLVFVLLFYYFSIKVLKSKFCLVFFIFFFAGNSSNVIDMAFAQGAYLLNLLYYIVFIIFFSLAFTETWEIRNKYCFAGLLIHFLYLSLHGPLSLAYYLIPFFGGWVLTFILQYAKSSWQDISKVSIRLTKTILATVIAVILGLFGYYLIAHHTGFSSGTNIVYPALSSREHDFIEFVLYAIGFQTEVSLFSLPGVMNVLIVFGLIGLIVCCVLLFRRYNEQPFTIKLLMNMSLFVFAIYGYFDFTVYSISIETYRYFFMPWVFLILLASYYLYTYVLSQGIVVKAVIILFLAAFSLPNMLFAVPQVAHYSQARAQQLGLVNFLRDHDLEHGYAVFGNAGCNMVLSDFDVEIGGVNIGDKIEPFLWLSSKITYDSNAYSGKSFLLLTQYENEAYACSHGVQRLGDPIEIFNFESYIIYVYPYNISENNFSGLGVDNFNYIYQMCESENSMRTDDNKIKIEKEQIIFGPYISLDPGYYCIEIEFAELTDNVQLRFTSEAGANLLQEDVQTQAKQTFFIDIKQAVTYFEVVINTDSSAVLSSVKINKVEKEQ